MQRKQKLVDWAAYFRSFVSFLVYGLRALEIISVHIVETDELSREDIMTSVIRNGCAMASAIFRPNLCLAC